MKTATIRDLRYRFPEVERALEDGEAITITKHGRPIAQLAPHRPTRPKKLKIPDILARLRQTFGDRVMEVSTAEMLRQEEDDRP